MLTKKKKKSKPPSRGTSNPRDNYLEATKDRDYKLDEQHILLRTPNLARALCNAQAELESVEKSNKGYGYNYASLPDTIQAAKEIIHRHGLCVIQLLGSDSTHGTTYEATGIENEEGKTSRIKSDEVQITERIFVGNLSVTTILLHVSGEQIQSTATLPLIDVPGANFAQAAGAVWTYIRRYAYQAILGMSSEDTDATNRR